jgi:hypothetical protein
VPNNRLSRIKAISFDGDMTLWDFRKVMRSALGHALAGNPPRRRRSSPGTASPASMEIA